MTLDKPSIPDPSDAPFDRELGLVYTELTPNGVRAQLQVKPTLTQPMGIVHGGVWCSMVESMASVSAYLWLSSTEFSSGAAPERATWWVSTTTRTSCVQ